MKNCIKYEYIIWSISCFGYSMHVTPDGGVHFTAFSVVASYSIFTLLQSSLSCSHSFYRQALCVINQIKHMKYDSRIILWHRIFFFIFRAAKWSDASHAFFFNFINIFKWVTFFRLLQFLAFRLEIAFLHTFSPCSLFFFLFAFN